MSASEYLNRLPQCLMTFQFIEEGLKMYIQAADVMIHMRMKDSLHYEASSKNLWRQPLGSLIRKFERRTDKKDLVAALRAVAEERNFFVHRGFLLTQNEVAGREDISQLLERLESVHVKAKRCLVDLVSESCRVRDETVSEDVLRQLGE
jgi:hypothetical protein